MNVAIMGEFPKESLALMKTKLENCPGSIHVEIAKTQEEAERLTDAECIILRILRLDHEAAFARYPKLKFIQKWGAGYDSIDMEEATKRGVLVSNTPGLNAFSVAEQTVMLMLCVYRNLINHYEFLKQGIWTKGRFMERTYSLKGKKVGLIGMGSIGKAVAKRVQSFEAEVFYYDPFRLSEEKETELHVTYLPLEELLRTADVVSLHLPLTPETTNLINAETLRLMKPTAILINAARGGLVDERALIGALERGELLGAGLDCMAGEPVGKEDPIFRAPNVTLTPHVGGVSMDLNGVMASAIVENVLRFAQTGKPNFVINKELLEA